VRRVNLRSENHRVETEMPRTTRRRNRHSLKKKQRGGDLVDPLTDWLANIKQERARLLEEVGGDPRNITFAKLAEKKFPIENNVTITIPGRSNTTIGNIISHIYTYLSVFFDNPEYTMENAREGLALREAEIEVGEEDLFYEFLSKVEATLSGQNDVKISNIQNYPLFVFYLFMNSTRSDPVPILMKEAPAGQGAQ
jgi:hypothetical protein